jgi:flavin-dependent dehydrogenase
MNISFDIPMNKTYDVIVAGGGPSGCTAAAAAARGGAKTLLIEGTGALGGMGTMGGVPAWCPFSDGKKLLYTGLAETVFRRAKEGEPHIKPEDTEWVPIHPEKLKRVFDDLVTASGADILFETQLCAVNSANGAVDGIVTANKSGMTGYQAKIYVDGTGDGDLAAWAGAEYVKGDEETGEMQMATHCFAISNVDMYA